MSVVGYELSRVGAIAIEVRRRKTPTRGQITSPGRLDAGITQPVGQLNPLIVMALPMEAQGLFDSVGVNVVFTGIGKVNAAYHLTRALWQARSAGTSPNLVVNFGTAGSPVHLTGSVLGCTRFVQRDMDVTGLGFDLGTTPFEDTPSILSFGTVFHQLSAATCATADRFETQSDRLTHEVIDMEAYALAKVCYLERVPFACAKYVTDGADHNAATSWESNLPSAARAFLELYHTLLDTST